MSQDPQSPSLDDIVKGELSSYYRHLAKRVETAVRAVPQEKLWVKPYDYGNSLGHLLLHLTGNLNHYVGSLVAGTGYVRDREFEFTDPTQHSGEHLLQGFHAAVDMVLATIAEQDDGSWGLAVSGQPPIETRFGLLLVCAAHLNNHIGQMAYLVRELGHDTNEPPIW